VREYYRGRYDLVAACHHSLDIAAPRDLIAAVARLISPRAPRWDRVRPSEPVPGLSTVVCGLGIRPTSEARRDQSGAPSIGDGFR
jgi:hypothetical protein